jgi:hypothetical protein
VSPEGGPQGLVGRSVGGPRGGLAKNWILGAPAPVNVARRSVGVDAGASGQCESRVVWGGDSGVRAGGRLGRAHGGPAGKWPAGQRMSITL